MHDAHRIFFRIPSYIETKILVKHPRFTTVGTDELRKHHETILAFNLLKYSCC